MRTRKRLNESQLRRLVRRIIVESHDDYEVPNIPMGDDPQLMMRKLDDELLDWPTYYRDYYQQLRDNAEKREHGYETDEEVDAWSQKLGYGEWSSTELQDLIDEMEDAHQGTYGEGGSY